MAQRIKALAAWGLSSIPGTHKGERKAPNFTGVFSDLHMAYAPPPITISLYLWGKLITGELFRAMLEGKIGKQEIALMFVALGSNLLRQKQPGRVG